MLILPVLQSNWIVYIFFLFQSEPSNFKKYLKKMTGILLVDTNNHESL